MRRIALFPGGGAGAEVTAEVLKVLHALQERSGTEFQTEQITGEAARAFPTDEQIAHFRSTCDAIFLTSLSDQADEQEVLRRLIAGLDLYVHYRPVQLWSHQLGPLKNKEAAEVDFAILAECSEGIHAGITGSFRENAPEEIVFRHSLFTRSGIERIVRHAFEFCRSRGLRRLELSYRTRLEVLATDLWEQILNRIGEEYPGIRRRSLPVGTLIAELLTHPQDFGVILTGNGYGEVIGEVGTFLQGGAGIAASAYLHPGSTSLFMPAIGSSARHIAPADANPLGALSALRLMLEHLGCEQEADWVLGALKSALDTKNTTPDLGGKLNTAQVGDFIAHQVRKGTS